VGKFTWNFTRAGLATYARFTKPLALMFLATLLASGAFVSTARADRASRRSRPAARNPKPTSAKAGPLAPRRASPKLTWVPFELTLVPPIHIFHPERKGIAGMGVNVLWGSTDALAGVEFGTLYNRVAEWGVGAQLAGGVNHVGGDFIGIQAAFVANYVGKASSGSFRGDCDCLQVGFVNVVGGRIRGLQLGFANVAWSDGVVVQLGAMNLAHKMGSDRGQWVYVSSGNGTVYTPEYIPAGKVNRDPTKVLRGAQISIANAALRIGGLQAALALNMVESFTGCQLGLVNVADRATGLQVGLLNVTGELKGVQLGLINLASRSKIPFLVGVNVGW